ncbi:hypothetical protein F4818DRAFT_442867 [Hypoxylon cercidicola]|nr:hypothetical protein F4818DRAFT_442867 [Hypoxylon cercidicola]
MASRLKEPSPTEAGSDSDVDLSFEFHKPSISIPQAMESIDKWKSMRSNIQKSIDKDFVDKLASLQSRIKAHYQDEARNNSDHVKQQLERLTAALEKRMACEEKISKCIDSLGDDGAHLAMLVDAIYAGRKEAATQTAKAVNPDILKDQPSPKDTARRRELLRDEM